jgi:hypothetical protein
MNVAFSNDNHVYGWSEKVFGDLVVSVPIPNIVSTADIFNYMTSNATLSMIEAQSLSIHQSLTYSGFLATGLLSVLYPLDFPDLKVDIGYLDVR